MLGAQFLLQQSHFHLFPPAPFAFEIRPLADLFAKKNDGFLLIPVFQVSFAIVISFEVG
jgi:hypothetical protein